MPDDICAQDQALIAAALAAGKVQCIPRGVSGVPLPVYQKSGHLTDGPAAGWRASISNFHKGSAGRKAGYVTPEVAARRIRVREMYVKGMTTAEIAGIEGALPEVIRRDLAALRKKGFAL